MARNREKPGSMTHQVKSILDGKLAIGRSKYQDQLLDRQRGDRINTGSRIYSWSTYRSYLKIGSAFGRWAHEKHDCRTIEAARSYVDEYLESRAGLSAYTQALDRSALAKLYSCNTTDFNVEHASRYRADIVRSRGLVERDRNYNEMRHADFVEFCRATGLRRSEIQVLKPEQLHEVGGTWYLHITGKGGREREAPIVGTLDQVVAVVEKIQSTVPGERVWSHISTNVDIHSYRADYATRCYRELARPLVEVPPSERYCCRNELAGTHLDRVAMLQVSRYLGHNRVSVIAGHYIRTDEL